MEFIPGNEVLWSRHTLSADTLEVYTILSVHVYNLRLTDGKRVYIALKAQCTPLPKDAV